MYKHALLSPAVNAGQAPPTEEAQRNAFEQQFGQMAYQAFSAKFPDLMNSVVTFKMLDTDLEASTATGAFVIERNGEYIYAPVVLVDNQLKPFDMMYVKSKDIFLPLSADWLDEVGKTTIASLGEGHKLPDTVATDVDIRNIVVPPTTGRYSYASEDVSPHSRLHAEASRPLERRLLNHHLIKTADGNGGGMMGSGSVTDPNYNPEIWATFVEQFGRIHQNTPGQALDNGTLDLETLAKMYKSHMKTWEMTQNPALAQQGGMGQQQGMQPGMQPGMPGQPGAQPGMPQAGAQPAPGMGMGGAPAGTGGAIGIQGTPPGMGAMPKMASAVPETAMHAIPDAIKQRVLQEAVAAGTHVPHATAGNMLDKITTSMGKGGLIGAGVGGLQAASDRDLGDVPGAMVRGGLSGAIGAPVGAALGKSFGHGNPEIASPAVGARIGEALGAATGGYMGARALPTSLADMATPSQRELESYVHQYPDQARFLYRQGSEKANINAGLKAMLKHAAAQAEHKLQLLDFLTKAPVSVKVAFAKVLDANPKVMKLAADIYGGDALIDALKPSKETLKTAGMVNASGGGSLYIYDKSTPAKKITEAFGSAAPEVFNGILLRGYYFKDTRPKLKLAVETQVYHDFHDARESGIYQIYNLKGEPKTALVVTEPYSLLEDTRPTFPSHDSRVKKLKNRVQSDDNRHEPGDMSSYELDYPERDVERSHKLNRLAIFSNGDYTQSTHMMGEMVTESVLDRGLLYSRIMTDGEASPKAGLGCFVYKRGAHYFGTTPCELKEISTSGGVTRGKVYSEGGFGSRNFVIDSRSPINRPRTLRDADLVVIPANWKWMPLNKRLESDEFLMSQDAISHIVGDALGSMGVHEIVVRDAGQSQFAVNGSRSLEKKAALVKIATSYAVHASAAEAMLKIAEHRGVSRAYALTPDQHARLTYTVKTAAGVGAPNSPMGGPPAMGGGGAQSGATPGTPPQSPPAPSADPNAAAAPPAPPPPSPIDQAFSEVAGGMQQQISQLQSSLNILMTVQQRAQQIQMEQSGGAPTGGMPPGMSADPSGGMQGPPPGMQPGMATDPSAGSPGMGGMGPTPSPGAAMPQGPQGGAVMATEAPSAQEIAGQVNPTFLANAGKFQAAGAFDAGAVGALAQNPSLKNMASQYAPGLENSVDDLGRTLLTLYMQEAELKEQLGDESFVHLETQLRDTFHDLGDLVLSLTHNGSMLPTGQSLA